MHTLFLAVSLFILLSFPLCSYAQTGNVNLSNLVSFDGEPSLAVNPQNPDNIIAGWMRLRLDGKIWIAVRSSFDGGATWSPMQFLPHVQPDYGSADVSIAFHRSGLAYLLYIDYRMVPDTVGGVYLAHSTDGGLRWSEPREAVSTIGRPDLPLDRPWVVVDNSGGATDGTVTMSVMSAYWYTGEHRIYTRSSSDTGATWSPLNRLDNDEYSPGLVTKSYGAISVGGDGKLYTAYLSYDTSLSPFLRMYAAVSSDAGATWQRAVIANVALTPSSFGYAQGYCIAADPVRPGHAVVAWIDERYGDSDVLLKRTTNGGLTGDPRCASTTIPRRTASCRIWSGRVMRRRDNSRWSGAIVGSPCRVCPHPSTSTPGYRRMAASASSPTSG
ncbi:MAG: exo-alpha-sialidase [Ignavibacteria bacterium]|nr:exo-alpha-sialidase [Ignavibacteria bacterium]